MKSHLLNIRKSRGIVAILISLIFCCSIPPVASAQSKDKVLEEYLLALEAYDIPTKIEETDFIIGNCDSASREEVAVKVFEHFRNSHLMGDENVAVHVADKWIHGNAAISSYADFNRASLLGMKAPLLPEAGLESFSKSKPTTLWFYDTDCAKCKLESVKLEDFFLRRSDCELITFYTGDNPRKWKEFISSHFTSVSSARHLCDFSESSDFRKLYSVTATPRMFLIDKEGIIVGRMLDTESLEKLLDERKAREKQAVTELFYRLVPLRGEDAKNSLEYIIDNYILCPDSPFDSAEDSLMVVNFAQIQKDLLSKARPGSKIAGIKVNGSLNGGKVKNRRLDRLGKNCSRNGGRTIIIFHTSGCHRCEAELKEAKALKLNTFAVNIDDIQAQSPKTFDKLFDAFDLSTLPFLVETDSKGIILRRYFSLCDGLPLLSVMLGSCSDVIYENEDFSWSSEKVTQGDYSAYAKSGNEIVSNYPLPDGKERRWTKKNDISRFGKYTGADTLETALYNMAADELLNNVEADSTFRTGALWAGVWTRDISYSIILSLSDLLPDISRISLLRKVDRLGRIVQDTGTGGSWPCSSDRVIWAVAAWKIYLATGDKDWLSQAYTTIKRSLEDDLAVTFDAETGLFRGESSFIDWRQQSYPRWMQPADIFKSECLGTNVVYYMVLQAMTKMAATQGFDDERKYYSSLADNLRDAINRELWMEDCGYYAQYLYGRDHLSLSPRSETLGESLAILSGVASEKQAKKIVSQMPVSAFGPTIFWPQIGGEKAYHNNAIWPFVTSFYALASARAENEQAVLHALASNVRAAALFATNHENMVASDGSLKTALNSPNMLWSLAGFLGTYRKLLLGIDIREDGISFSPFVPRELGSCRKLEGLKYKNMTIDLTVKGHGRGIKSFRLDDKKSSAFLPESLEGHHSVEIVLDGRHGKRGRINQCSYTTAPDTPNAVIENGALVWEPVDGAGAYIVLRDAEAVARTTELSYSLDDEGEYQLIAEGSDSIRSFASEPLRFCQEDNVMEIAVEKWLSRGEGIEGITVNIPADGRYFIDWKYANGNGGVTDKNMCATRAMYVDGVLTGMSVFPQRAYGDWENFGWSSSCALDLTAGEHEISLKFLPCNENMNIDGNKARIAALRITRY